MDASASSEQVKSVTSLMVIAGPSVAVNEADVVAEQPVAVFVTTTVYNPGANPVGLSVSAIVVPLVDSHAYEALAGAPWTVNDPSLESQVAGLDGTKDKFVPNTASVASISTSTML